MKRKHWFILLGIALAIALCCCIAVSGAAGLIYFANRSAEAMQDDGTGLSLPDEPGSPRELDRDQPTAAERATMQRLVSVEIPVRDLTELAVRLRGLPESVANLPVEPSPPYQPGDKLDFWVHDVSTNSFFKSTTSLGFATDHAYWWVEDGYEVSADDLRRSALIFESETYPTNRHFFGTEWQPGVDGDPHVYIFLGNVPGVGGYFSGPDEYPAHISTYSNQHEMFYINLDNAGPGNEYFDGILAHEFQHMIHWAVDRNEDTWVNEGLSELAALLNGFDVGGSDYLFSLAPDTQLNAWPELDNSGPHYGASYLFLTYFLERYGEEALRQLVAEPANGISGFEAILGRLDPDTCCFSELFADWVVANYLDSPKLADGRYGYSSLRIEAPLEAASYGSFPVAETASVHQFAVDYVLLEGRGEATVEFTGSLKVPLVGAIPTSGEHQWWSNRGDDGDATLTRRFDLAGLSSATLEAWMWYDLELDFDYAYVQVSPDEGQSWTLLSNEHTTLENPTGSSYGPALNGRSGGGDQPAWVRQTFDLTPFAGKPILVRFEVVYDDSVNYPGLCIDDISIPELGFADNVEGGDSGWEAQGWARITGNVPQEYIVQVIILGRNTVVERLRLDERNRGSVTLSGLGREIDSVVLAISGTTPITTELAPYTLRVTQP